MTALSLPALLALAEAAQDADDARVAAIEVGGAIDGVGYALAMSQFRETVTPDVVIALIARVRESEAGDGIQCCVCGASVEPVTCSRCILVNDAALNRSMANLYARKLELADARIAALSAGLVEACDIADGLPCSIEQASRIAQLRALAIRPGE